MEEKKIETIVNNFEQKLRQWLINEKRQENAYEYEKSYVEFMQKVSQEALSKITSNGERSRNRKKKFKHQ